MLFDVVVDTNVFLHSIDKRQAWNAATCKFLANLLGGNTYLCVDEGFDIDESKNRSHIGSEYLNKLRFVNSAMQLLVTLGKSGRILKVRRSTEPRTGKIIRRSVTKKSDRIFVKVAYNTQSKVLVSHDFEDFPIPSRRQLLQKLELTISTAIDAQDHV